MRAGRRGCEEHHGSSGRRQLPFFFLAKSVKRLAESSTAACEVFIEEGFVSVRSLNLLMVEVACPKLEATKIEVNGCSDDPVHCTCSPETGQRAAPRLVM